MYGHPDDCIHLHACRRMKRIYMEAFGSRAKKVSRGCDYECSCYQTAEPVEAVEIHHAIDRMRQTVDILEYGYSPDDINCRDFRTVTLFDIEDGENCRDSEEW